MFSRKTHIYASNPCLPIWNDGPSMSAKPSIYCYMTIQAVWNVFNVTSISIVLNSCLVFNRWNIFVRSEMFCCWTVNGLLCTDNLEQKGTAWGGGLLSNKDGIQNRKQLLFFNNFTENRVPINFTEKNQVVFQENSRRFYWNLLFFLPRALPSKTFV